MRIEKEVMKERGADLIAGILRRVIWKVTADNDWDLALPVRKSI